MIKPKQNLSKKLHDFGVRKFDTTHFDGHAWKSIRRHGNYKKSLFDSSQRKRLHREVTRE